MRTVNVWPGARHRTATQTKYSKHLRSHWLPNLTATLIFVFGRALSWWAISLLTAASTRNFVDVQVFSTLPASHGTHRFTFHFHSYNKSILIETHVRWIDANPTSNVPAQKQNEWRTTTQRKHQVINDEKNSQHSFLSCRAFCPCTGTHSIVCTASTEAQWRILISSVDNKKNVQVHRWRIQQSVFFSSVARNWHWQRWESRVAGDQRQHNCDGVTGDDNMRCNFKMHLSVCISLTARPLQHALRNCHGLFAANREGKSTRTFANTTVAPRT